MDYNTCYCTLDGGISKELYEQLSCLLEDCIDGADFSFNNKTNCNYNVLNFEQKWNINNLFVL